jgi:GTP-binding protein
MKLRNVAIIAHVDHGKTTLVDRLLQQSGTYRENQRVVERAMDSNDLERERGITILAKAASVQWKDTRINIVDTPGHADFGGEVERILNMVDGALVLVDAAEGPLPQTKFVVSKALKVGLKPIVVINKVDRPDARPTEVINEVFDLFAALDASEEQLDFPILYGSAKQGWMAESPEGPKDKGMQPLFDLILRHVAPPTVEEGPFRMIGTILEANPYLGRIITGRITSGSIKPNQAVKVLGGDGRLIENGRITKIIAFRGIERTHLLRSHRRYALEGAADRSADSVDVVHRQQFAARWHRRRQGDQPHDPRPPAARSRGQRRAARDRGFRPRFDGSLGPRRIAACDPDRDHAPRRF